MQYALDRNYKFEYLADISGTSFPIKSNKIISETLARRKNAIYVNIIPIPTRPALPEMWNHYIECDGMIHRVGRLPLPRGNDYSAIFISLSLILSFFLIPFPYLVFSFLRILLHLSLSSLSLSLSLS